MLKNRLFILVEMIFLFLFVCLWHSSSQVKNRNQESEICDDDSNETRFCPNINFMA